MNLFSNSPTISILNAKPKECVSNPIQYYSPIPKWGCDVMHASGLYESVSKVVGKGGWRNVYAGEYKDEDVVLKKLNLWHHIIRSTSTESNKKDMYKKFRLEASILDNLKECQNVPQLLGYCGMDIATEKMDDTLKHAVEHNANRPDSALRALEMSLGVTHGIQCLSNMKYGPVVHGDLHIDQFLVDKEGKAYINDFDKSIPLGRNNVTGAPCSFVKKPAQEEYMIPRLSIDIDSHKMRKVSSLDNSSLLNHEPDYYSYPSSVRGHPDVIRFGLISEKTDIYSLGDLIYYIISNGQSPPEVRSPASVNMYALKYGSDIVNVLMDTWEEWPDLRPSADEVASRLSTLLEDFRSGNGSPQV